MTGSGGGARRAPRSRGPGLSLLTVLAVAVPAATVGSLAVIEHDVPPSAVLAPEVQELDRADLGCPSAVSGEQVLLGSAGEGPGGVVELRVLDQEDQGELEPVTPGSVTSADTGAGAVLVTGRERLAPGLLALRSGGAPLAAGRCVPPRPETWFAGLGARADHASVIELANPDLGAAVVDVEVHAPRGVLDVPELRGLRVPGRTSVRIDLSVTVPRRPDLAVRVAVSRGRAAVSVEDSVGDVGGVPVREWIPGQPAPEPEVLLLGLPAGTGTRTLSLVNPGSDEVRVSVRVVAPESVFTPAGVEEVRVGPGAAVSVQLDQVLAEETARGAMGLLVTAPAPVVATLASVVDGDLSLAGDPGQVTDRAVALLPEGRARLLVAGAVARGVATVVARSAAGEVLARTPVEVRPDRGQEIDLPTGTASVDVSVEGTTVVGAVLVSGSGATVLPLVELDLFGYIPGVRPALP